MQKSNKDLDIYAYFETLQKEYVSAELRSKIYKKKKDREYYRDRVMSGKKEKILNISDNNRNLPNIFNDPVIKDQIYTAVKPAFGFPRFTYANEAQHLELSLKDKEYYYSIGEMFKVRIEERVVVGKLINVDFDKQIAELEVKGNSHSSLHTFSNISRIL